MMAIALSRTGSCVSCDDPLEQTEVSAGVWRPIWCGKCWSADRRAPEGVPVLCRRCRGASVEVLRVLDGPGIRIQQLSAEEARPGDVSGSCRVCGNYEWIRILQPGA